MTYKSELKLFRISQELLHNFAHNALAYYRKKYWLLFGLLLALLFLALCFEAKAQKTNKIYLSGIDAVNTKDWDFFCTAGTKSGYWTKNQVPSCWEMQGFGSYDYGRNNPLGNRLKEEGFYKYEFVADDNWKNTRINLVFDGVMTDCEVKLNNKVVGEIHQGAFYQFKYPINSFLKIGKSNLLEVHVKKQSSNVSVNTAEREADYWVFGGIFRPVYLEINPEKHIERVAIDAKANGTFNADVFLSQPLSEGTVKVEIVDQNNKIVAELSAPIHKNESKIRVSGKLENPKLWSPEFPKLYTVQFSLLDNKENLLHQTLEKIGFRTVEVREQDGIYVNNVRIKFKGVNRHTFRADYGRASSKSFSIEDVNLIKDMNMNAVRMSHYPPEKHFLDACDSLGLFVLNELAGWQVPPYDSLIGKKLLREMIVHDVNHPSIVLWDNGNEGGWNTAYDADFKELDIQKREVLHPWAVFEKTNTAHYITYNYLSLDNFAQRKIFFPTEFLHGLYDGGHGAGLEDYWHQMYYNPLCAGGFLWSFADECLFRSDIKGLDCKGNQAPDGILGPYLEKEGSFYSIREIWSPIHFEKKYISPEFNGVFNIENRYHFTNLNQCQLSYEWLQIKNLDSEPTINTIDRGKIETGNFSPDQKGSITVNQNDNWMEADILSITAIDPYGRLIHTWTWPVKSADKFYFTKKPKSLSNLKPIVTETEGNIILKVNEVSIEINKLNGTLAKVSNKNGAVPLKNGPFLCNNQPKLIKISHEQTKNGHAVYAQYESDAMEVKWEMQNNGLVNLEVAYHLTEKNASFTGISFNYAEENIKNISYIGNGPYRVWKNRMAGPTFGFWEKPYNNTITVYRVESYPEFKGYYSDFYWAKFESNLDESFAVFSKSDDLFLRIFTPEDGEDPAKTAVKHPKGDISFLKGIPAIGTKFTGPEVLGPQSQTYSYVPKRVENGKINVSLTFDFAIE